MKILIISSAFPPHVFGGGEVAAYNFTKLLCAHGYDVSVATMQERDAEPIWGKIMPEGYKLYRLKLPRTHTFYSRNKISAWKKIIWHFQDYFDNRNKKIFEKLLQDIKPTHIDIHNIVGIGFNVLPIINKHDCSVAYFTHDLNIACFKGSMFKGNSNCIRQCIQCKAISYARKSNLSSVKGIKFISPSKVNLDKLSEYVPVIKNSQVTVIRNVPDALPIYNKKVTDVKSTNKTMKLIYVGRLDPIKGIGFLLETLDSLKNNYKFSLKVLGTGPLEDSLRSIYHDENWVEFCGFVDRSVVALEVAKADLFCMPSLWAETYGLVTAQALQVGTPVIGSNIGGTTELVRNLETGILVKPGDKEAWQNELINIFENPELLKKWSENTTKYKDEFDSEKILKSYLKFVFD